MVEGYTDYPTSTEEVREGNDSDAEKDSIPDLVSEENGNPALAARIRYTLPRIEEAEWTKPNGGGEI